MHSKVQQHSVKPKEPSEREAEVFEDETEEKQELIEKESVKEESVKEESVKEESVKEESVKEESVKEESVKEDDPFYEENDFDDEPVSKEDEHNSLLNKSNHSLGEDAVEEGFSQKEPLEDTETKKEDPFKEEDKPAKSNKAADLFASMKGQQALFPSRQPVKQDKVAVKPVSTPLKKENKPKSNPFSKNNDNLFGAKPGSGGKKNPFAK